MREKKTGTRKLLYSLARSCRGKNRDSSHCAKDRNGNLLVESEIVVGRWEYFEEFLNIRDMEASEVNSPQTSKEEVERMFEKMKKDKEAGDDSIPVELI